MNLIYLHGGFIIHFVSNNACRGGGGAGARGGNGDDSCDFFNSRYGSINGGDGLQSDITGQQTWYSG